MGQGPRLTEGGGKMGFNLENKLVTDLLRNTIQPPGGSDAFGSFCMRDLPRHISASDLCQGGGLICTSALYLSKVRSRTTCFLFSLEWDSARFRSHSHKNGWLKVNLKEIGLAKWACWNLGDSHKSKVNNHTSGMNISRYWWSMCVCVCVREKGRGEHQREKRGEIWRNVTWVCSGRPLSLGEPLKFIKLDQDDINNRLKLEHREDQMIHTLFFFPPR